MMIILDGWKFFFSYLFFMIQASFVGPAFQTFGLRPRSYPILTSDKQGLEGWNMIGRAQSVMDDPSAKSGFSFKNNN